MGLYVVVLIIALVGAYLHLVSTDVLTSVIGLVIGHGTGLFTPAPSTDVIKNG